MYESQPQLNQATPVVARTVTHTHDDTHPWGDAQAFRWARFKVESTQGDQEVRWPYCFSPALQDEGEKQISETLQKVLCKMFYRFFILSSPSEEK